MSTDTLQDFVQARLLAFDPTIDLSDGSPAQDQVVDPIVRRFQPDPFEMSIEDFIDARLKQEVPTMSIQEGTGVRDLLVKPSQVLLDPISREVQLIKQGQSLANPDLLADTEADALVANFFVARNLGDLSEGKVRLYFNAPIAINVSVGNVCYTADGLRFLPTTIQSISAEAMVFNQSGNLYYFDINVTAESPGEQYNIDPQTITGITNLNVAVRVTNLAKFENGLNQESTTDLIQRASDSITERSLVVPRGVIARLHDQFNNLEQLQIIGMFDAEMHRDILTGGDLGAFVASGNDGYVEDDGLGGTTTTRFRTYLNHNLSAAFSAGGVEKAYLLTNEASFGTDGVVSPPNLSYFSSASAAFTSEDVGRLISIEGTSNTGLYVITAVLASTVVVLENPLTSLPFAGVDEAGIPWTMLRAQRQTLIAALMGPTELKLATPIPLNSNLMSWTIRKKELTISGMPGGIIYSADAKAVSIQSDEVHIGGCTDFYVRGSSTNTLDVTLDNITDEEPLLSSNTGIIENALLPGYNQYFTDPNVDFVASGVQPGMSLVIPIGTDAGTYMIVEVGFNSAGSAEPHYIRTTANFGTARSDIQYSIVDDVNIDLVSPKTIRTSGLEGQTVQLGQIFTTADLVDFVAFGAAVGDTLRILTGPDAGDYGILGFTGTNNRNLTLSRPTSATTTDLSWVVFKAQTGVQLPLVRIKSVNLLDSGGTPTGTIIPRSEPVDARSTIFANAGDGEKLSILDGIVGIVGSLDLITQLSYPLDPTEVVITHPTIGGFTNTTVTLTGCSSPDEIIQTINDAIPNIAGTIAGDNGELYLTLRSSDRWIRVLDATGMSVGLTAGDDNRQIRRASDAHFPWTDPAYDLRINTDVVHITTGDAAGDYYFAAIDMVSYVYKIMIVGFDETSGTVRFPEPSIGVELSVGSRSLGAARVYFLDPCTFEAFGAYHPALKNTTTCPSNEAVGGLAGEEITADEPTVTYFNTALNGSGLRFIPDPAMKRVLQLDVDGPIFNNLVLGTVVTMGTATSNGSPSGALGKYSRHADVPLSQNGVQAGDLIEITYQPLQGTVDLTTLFATPPSVLVGQTLVLRVDGKKNTVTFTANVTSPTTLVNEINDAVGMTLAFVEGTGPEYIRLEAEVLITVITAGTATATLGLDSTVTSNASYAQGSYRVISTHPDPFDPSTTNQVQILDLDGNPPIPPPSGYSDQAHHFRVVRPGAQRISSTDMNKQTESGLHYVDIQLVSCGSGDLWNIPEGLVFVVTGYTSDGYKLEVADTNLSYSTQEQVRMILTSGIIPVGSTDIPASVTPLAGLNIQVEYEESDTVSAIQAFASSDLDRVLTASILVRHLFPAYINFDMHYVGGSSVDVVTTDVLDYLTTLSPNDKVEASIVQGKATRRGASAVTNPITLLAISYDNARQVSVDRSYDSVSKGRLSTFFEGNINIIQDSSSS